ncbi:MAG: hypothetical protein ACWGOX_14170, partial [Desulforhopalus sp.]
MRQNKCAKTKRPEGCAGTREPLPLNQSQADDVGTAGRLNFSSKEFNRIDELDDNIGNYREFESLDGIVTSDMRYHEKRKQTSRPDTA